jgi:outer membrane protein assembly factor BamE (lipoprotein component of BamABCDE complex)
VLCDAQILVYVQSNHDSTTREEAMNHTRTPSMAALPATRLHSIQRILPLLFAATLLAGCATVGNEKMATATQATVSQQITEGKTTKNDVRTTMGDADAVSFTDSGNEIWTYKHARATPKATNFIPVVNWFVRGADVTTRELVVLFDKNNVVTKYTMRETQSEVKSGLAQ